MVSAGGRIKALGSLSFFPVPPTTPMTVVDFTLSLLVLCLMWTTHAREMEIRESCTSRTELTSSVQYGGMCVKRRYDLSRGLVSTVESP